MRVRRAAFVGGRDDAERIVANFIAVAETLGISRETVVAGYWPIGGEADVRPLLAKLSDMGATCVLPVIEGSAQALRFREWRPGDQLGDAPLGTRQPTADKPWGIPDVVLVPLLAFDARGYRLGQGGGYYDRTLTGLSAFSVGIAYSCQQVSEVPRDAHDRRLDWIVTEQALIEAKEE